MADDGSTQSMASRPIRHGSFSVSIGTNEFRFREIIGLNEKKQAVEYDIKTGSPAYTNKPDGRQSGTIILKKEIIKSEENFPALYKALSAGRRTNQKVSISLIDEADEIAMSWTVINAHFDFGKTSSVNLHSTAEERFDIDNIELAHEGCFLTF